MNVINKITREKVNIDRMVEAYFNHIMYYGNVVDVKQDISKHVLGTYELDYNRNLTINQLVNMQECYFFEEQPEQDMDFYDLPDEDLEYYFDEWINSEYKEVLLSEYVERLVDELIRDTKGE